MWRTLLLLSSAVLAVCGCGQKGLGGECTSGSDCESGICHDGVCAAELGEDCETDADCVSGICTAFHLRFVCSECREDADCGSRRVCLNHGRPDTGYFACAGAVESGEACIDRSECMSGACEGGVCSQCELDSGCPHGICTDDREGRGYFACLDLDLGDACEHDHECGSSRCSEGVCSECRPGGHCAFGPCEYGEDEGYFVCLGGHPGDACALDSDCRSGYCFEPEAGSPVCAVCWEDGNCGVQQVCAHSEALGYPTCLGAGDPGDSCEAGDRCRSGFCVQGVCSDCAGDGDCSGGGTCVDDLEGVGYFACVGGLGDACAGDGDCHAAHCFDPGAGPAVCSECGDDADCDVQQACTLREELGYAVCRGTGEPGERCDGDGQCVSGTCRAGLCVGELGDPCALGADCISGHCFEPQAVCSACEDAGDCGVQRRCAYDQELGYATCLGAGDPGDSCQTGDQCSSGSCLDGACT